MRRIQVALVAAVLGCAPASDTAQTDTTTATEANPVVVLETTKGVIAIELFPDGAPETVRNFLLHVNSGFFDGLIFHRARTGYVIQTGGVTAEMRRRNSTVFPIANEAQNGLKNVRGAVAMARMGDPHSATSEFFINLVDNPTLDFREATTAGWGYAVFGAVLSGMDVVDSIAAVAVERRGRYEAMPLDPIVISRAYVRAD